MEKRNGKNKNKNLTTRQGGIKSPNLSVQWKPEGPPPRGARTSQQGDRETELGRREKPDRQQEPRAEGESHKRLSNQETQIQRSSSLSLMAVQWLAHVFLFPPWAPGYPYSSFKAQLRGLLLQSRPAPTLWVHITWPPAHPTGPVFPISRELQVSPWPSSLNSKFLRCIFSPF